MPNVAITKYLDVIVEYDPEKKVFCAEVEGKKLEHKKQSKLEALIKKAIDMKHPKWRGRKPAINKMRCCNPQCGSDNVKFIDKGERVHCNACNQDMPWLEAYKIWQKLPAPPAGRRGRKLQEEKRRRRGPMPRLTAPTGKKKVDNSYTDADLVKENDNIDIAAGLLETTINKHSVPEESALESFRIVVRMQLSTTISNIKTFVAAIAAGRK